MSTTVSIQSVTEIARETLAFDLKRPADFSFKPGQHVDLGIENMEEPDEKGSVRTLSIVSAPDEEMLTFATRYRDTGFKRMIKQADETDVSVSIDGPFGNMTLHSKTERPAVMFAGGVGITPFISMLRHIRDLDLAYQVRLYYSARTPSDAPFLEELVQLSEELAAFELVLCFTEVNSGERAKLEKQYGDVRSERIDQSCVAESIEKCPDAVWYAAGPPGFASAMEELVLASGVDDDDIRTEAFGGY